MDMHIVAQILGVYLVVSGLFLIFRGRTLPLLLKDFIAHRSVTWLAGLILLVLGGMLAFGDVGSSWVTLLGWLVMVKGIVYILMPEVLNRFASPKSRTSLIFLGLLTVAFGLTLLA